MVQSQLSRFTLAFFVRRQLRIRHHGLSDMHGDKSALRMWPILPKQVAKSAEQPPKDQVLSCHPRIHLALMHKTSWKQNLLPESVVLPLAHDSLERIQNVRLLRIADRLTDESGIYPQKADHSWRAMSARP